jgi:hypothetical protein
MATVTIPSVRRVSCSRERNQAGAENQDGAQAGILHGSILKSLLVENNITKGRIDGT